MNNPPDKIMNTTTTEKFDLSRSLLDQLDQRAGLDAMQKAAITAYGVIRTTLNQSAVSQELMVAKFGLMHVTSVNTTDASSVSYAVIAASLLAAAKTRRMTAHEKLEAAALNLSLRYQADW